MEYVGKDWMLEISCHNSDCDGVGHILYSRLQRAITKNGKYVVNFKSCGHEIVLSNLHLHKAEEQICSMNTSPYLEQAFSKLGEG